MSATSIVQDFQTPASVRWTSIFGILSSLLFAIIAWMAYWREGAQIGLWALPLCLGLLLYWVRQAWMHWQWVRMENNHVSIHKLLGTSEIDYRAITNVQLYYQRLHLTTHHDTITLRGHADTLTQIALGLETRLAALAIYHVKPADRPLPITVWAQWQGAAIMGGFGLLIFAVGVISLFYLVGQLDVPLADWLGQVAIAGVISLVGALVVYMDATNFVCCYRFTSAAITAHTLVKKRTFDPTQIKAVTCSQEKVRYRQQFYTLHRLVIDFVDGQTLVVEPGTQNFRLEYNEVYEQYILDKLHDYLRYHYGEVPRQQRLNH